MTSRKKVPKELTEEEIQRMQEVFLLFDKDGNNTITVRELGTVMRALGQKPTEEELRMIIAEIDADGNGIVEYPEFIDLMSRRPRGFVGSESELREAFRGFDTLSDGHVNMAELRRALTNIGEPLTDEQLDKMFSQIVPDGDGFVKYDTFIEQMMTP